MKFSSVVNSIKTSILKKELVVLCGAGVSYNSGMPLAIPLRNALLESLELDFSDSKLLMKSEFPFEGYMQAVLENFDPSYLFKIFTGGSPNANHHLLATLAGSGFLHEIYTTNFDLLIESALEKNNLCRGKDFHVLFDDNHFVRLTEDSGSIDVIYVVKLHGSAEDPQRMRTTLEGVCSALQSQERTDLIKRLFAGDHNKAILVLGYSFSDVFDITPQIKALGKIEKDIFIVDHAEQTEVITTEDLPDDHLFKNSNTLVLKCDTDKFLRTLWSECAEYIGLPISSRMADFTWSRYVSDWKKQLETYEPYLKEFISANLLIRVGEYRRAEHYLEKLWNDRTQVKNRQLLDETRVNLSHCYSQRGQNDKAYEIAHTGITENAESDYLMAKNYLNAAHSLYNLGDFESAKHNYEQALELNKKLKDFSEMAYSRTGLGNVANKQKNFETAIFQFQRSLKLHRLCGNKAGEAGSFMGLGNTHFELGDNLSALECFSQGLEIMKLIDNKHGQAQCLLNKANTNSLLGEYTKAENDLLIAAKIASDICDTELTVEVVIGKANLNMRLGDEATALHQFNQALMLAQRLGNNYLISEIEKRIALFR